MTPLATLLPAICLLCAPAISLADGAEKPGEGPFRPALPGYKFTFPRDHGSHDDFQTEWWYYTGHLVTEAGEEYGYQLTFFRRGIRQTGPRNPSRWAIKNLYFGHFAVSDLKKIRHIYGEKISRAGIGKAGAEAGRLKVWIDDWMAEGDGDTQRLVASHENISIDLTVRSRKPPVIHGEEGISRKGEKEGNASHYYSLTHLLTEGTVVIDGEKRQVRGISWMDHEFGSQILQDDQEGWDWFSVQLDTDIELMLFQIRRVDGSVEPASSGTIVFPDGRFERIRQFHLEILERWRSPKSQALYPLRWRIRIPEYGLELLITPSLPDQELLTTKSTRITYWEGSIRVRGSQNGKEIRGKGYLEMTGYAGRLGKRLSGP